MNPEPATNASAAPTWASAAVSLLVLALFGAMAALALFRTIPPGSEPIMNTLLGTLSAMAMTVISYWVGSSAGSARKDERLAQLKD